MTPAACGPLWPWNARTPAGRWRGPSPISLTARSRSLAGILSLTWFSSTPTSAAGTRFSRSSTARLCIDLDSRTRLRWDGATEPQTRGWLVSGSTLQVGPYAIRRAGDESPGCRNPEIPDPLAGWATDSTETPSLPGAGLVLPIRIGDGDQFWRMEGRFALIGRAESCQLMLRDHSVSRYHAAVVRTPKGAWIVDLHGREGVLINGVRVKWAWLEDGDNVRIGQFTSILRLRIAT